MVVVLDCGSRTVKAGFSGENVPRVEFPNVIGHHRPSSSLHSQAGPSLVGTNALLHRAAVNLSQPVKYGRIDDWSDVEQVWEHTYTQQLHTSPESCPTILTETTDEQPRHREKKTEIFFEKFGVPQFSLALQSVLALYSVGRTNGIVVDLGDGHSNVVPVIGGFSLRDVTVPIEYCGYDATVRLLESLKHVGFRDTPAHLDIAYHIKESCSYVRSITQQADVTTYTLPDNTTLTFDTNSQQLCCMEEMFTGAECIPAAIRRIAAEVAEEQLAGNIVLSGGSADCPGFADRLTAELRNQGDGESNQGDYEIVPNKASKSRYSTWLGGSILGSLSNFSSMCVSAAEYAEFGAGLINRRNVMEIASDQLLYGNYSFSGC